MGFDILPLRAVRYTLSNSSAWLIVVQLLDGGGAEIFGAITSLVSADPVRGPGRYNAAQGVVATAQGIGSPLSGFVAGMIVDQSGYSAAFLTSAAAVAIAVAALAAAMPETMSSGNPAPPGQLAARAAGTE